MKMEVLEIVLIEIRVLTLGCTKSQGLRWRESEVVTLFVMKMVDARSRIDNLSISKGSDSKKKRKNKKQKE